MKKLTIMRGVPGSGKSFKAAAMGGLVLSTDDYFMNKFGVYAFNPKVLKHAHAWNQKRAAEAMQNNVPHVIVVNTCCQAWEAREYCLAANVNGYEVEFVCADSPWAQDAHECAARNQHGVPLSAIVAMLSRFETNQLTVEACLLAKAPWEK